MLLIGSGGTLCSAPGLQQGPGSGWGKLRINPEAKDVLAPRGCRLQCAGGSQAWAACLVFSPYLILKSGSQGSYLPPCSPIFSLGLRPWGSVGPGCGLTLKTTSCICTMSKGILWRFLSYICFPTGLGIPWGSDDHYFGSHHLIKICYPAVS